MLTHKEKKLKQAKWRTFFRELYKKKIGWKQTNPYRVGGTNRQTSFPQAIQFVKLRKMGEWIGKTYFPKPTGGFKGNSHQRRLARRAKERKYVSA